MSSTRIRVACIDDNRLMLEAMKCRMQLVEGLDWRGFEGGPGLRIEDVASFEPDVLLLDIDMPGLDAFDIVRLLLHSAPKTRTVMLSGHVRRDYFERAVDAGAWGYLSKSEGLDTVIAAIHRVIAGEFVVTSEVEGAQRSNGLS